MSKGVYPSLTMNSEKSVLHLLDGYEVNAAHSAYSFKDFAVKAKNEFIHHYQRVHGKNAIIPEFICEPATDGPSRPFQDYSYVSRMSISISNKHALPFLKATRRD